MAKYLIISMSTNALPNYKVPADDPAAPRLAQIATVSYDRESGETERRSFYIRPDSWQISDEAQKINGLTTQALEEIGVPVAEVLDLYERAIDDGAVIVGHGASFATKTLRGELRRAGRDDRYAQTRTICTMMALTKECGLSNTRGAPKWPKLSEAYEHCFGTALPAPVRPDLKAQRDAEACFLLFKEMEKRHLVPSPKVPEESAA
jgi:DNA polymerase III epsilon subunit-like protein